MESSNYSSKILAHSVAEFSKLPGVGGRTALRLVLHLLKQPKSDIINFGQSFIELAKNIKHCSVCHNVSDHEVCEICNNPKRNHRMICVVETIRDVMAIEQTRQYQGVYHVLCGKISPMDGVGPSDLTIDKLSKRIEKANVDELILALSTTMEGDTTNFYLYKKFGPTKVKITTLARGLSVGDELEYADEVTLGRSITNRIDYQA